ncbi:MAG: site-specific integrase, partial [Pseudomonadota bacterium]
LMPAGTLIEQRNRAAFALLLLTGIRVGALISLRNQHLDTEGQNVFQDAREVRTKFSKTSRIYFIQDFSEAKAIVRDWERTQREVMLRGPDDPLFPSTEIEAVAGKGFQATGLTRTFWKSTGTLGTIVRGAFEVAGFPPFTPHSVRHMHARRGLSSFENMEQFKAHSENLGHEDISTTLNSYASLPEERRRQLILGEGIKCQDE